MLAFPPADPAHLVIRDERRFRPDPVLVEAAADRQAHRKEVRVVEEHHRLAECLPVQDHQLGEDEQAQRHSQAERHGVLRRLRSAPREQRAVAAPEKPHVVDGELEVRHEEAEAKQ